MTDNLPTKFKYLQENKNHVLEYLDLRNKKDKLRKKYCYEMISYKHHWRTKYLCDLTMESKLAGKVNNKEITKLIQEINMQIKSQ